MTVHCIALKRFLIHQQRGDYIGHLLFQKRPLIDQFNAAVSASAQLTTQAINHVGIIINTRQVMHAIPNRGVEILSLSDFMQSCSQHHLGKLNVSKARLNLALKRARYFCGQRYNETFYPDGEGLYCSQLITQIFSVGKNYANDHFKLQPMQFSDESLEFWQVYYQQRGCAMPQGVMGSHPQGLFDQAHCYHARFKVVAATK